MGAKTGLGAVQTMNLCFRFKNILLISVAFAVPGAASGALTGISFNYETSVSAQALTTERVSELDAQWLDPHRVLWVLERSLEWSGVTVEPIPGSRKAVRLAGGVSIRAAVTRHIRGDGPWFFSDSEKSCYLKLKARKGFGGTQAGALQAMEEAETAWRARLERGRVSLWSRLSSISGPDEAFVRRVAAREYERWLEALNKAWRTEILPKAHQGEQKFNALWAKGAEREKCARADLSTESLMPLTMTERGRKPWSQGFLARAPARVWDGWYSVRLSVDFGGKRLNGQFLIDPSVASSFVTESWLEGQGVHPVLVSATRGAGLFSERVELSGLLLPMQRFDVRPTAREFSGPRYLDSCCDGALGRDFLMEFAVGFDPGPMSEVRLWPKKGFALVDESGNPKPWSEVSLSRAPLPISFCDSVEVIWTWQPDSRKQTGAGKPSDVRCGSMLLEGGAVSPRLASALPWISGGKIVFDFGNGRVWFPEPLRRQDTGESCISLAFEYGPAGRQLRVLSIRKQGECANALKSGLKPGSIVTSVSGRAASELDAWSLERALLHGREALRAPWKRENAKIARTKPTSQHAEDLNQLIESEQNALEIEWERTKRARIAPHKK